MPSSATSLARRLGAPGAGPAYLWLADRIRGEIMDGALLIGERVPSERAVAEATGLSRTTVSAAYLALRAEGFLRSRPGSNTIAALPAMSIARPDSDAVGESVADEIDLTVAALPAPAVLASLAVEAARDLAPLASGHGLHPMGIAPLRAAVADHLSATGLPTRADQVLITQGALHGWDLALRAFVSPGQTVLVEQPSYPGVIDAARAHSARVWPLAVTAHGWQLDTSIRGIAPALVHVTPSHQNPTGFDASLADRSALRHAVGDAIVVVDDTFADLGFGDRQPRPGDDGRTITVGSLSKSVWAGLRVGWLRASPELVRRIAMSRSSQDLSTPVLDQLLAVRCFAHLAAILADRVDMVRPRRDHLLTALAERAPDWTCVAPSGGLVLWVDLGGRSSAELARRGLSRGVRVTPGSRFSASGTHDRFLRLPFSHPPAALDAALSRLLEARDELAPDGRHELAAPRWTA